MKCKPWIRHFQPPKFSVSVHNVHFMVCAVLKLDGKRQIPINIKKFGGTPPILDCNYPVDVPICPVEMYRGHSVQSMWNCKYLRSGRPGCPGTRPQTVTGTLPRHIGHQIPLCVLCLSAFLLPIKADPDKRFQNNSSGIDWFIAG